MIPVITHNKCNSVIFIKPSKGLELKKGLSGSISSCIKLSNSKWLHPPVKAPIKADLNEIEVFATTHLPSLTSSFQMIKAFSHHCLPIVAEKHATPLAPIIVCKNKCLGSWVMIKEIIGSRSMKMLAKQKIAQLNLFGAIALIGDATIK